MNPAPETKSGPLGGVRVLEFSQIVAGPVVGMQLADLGADVVKVEPLEGEGRRNSGAVIPGEGKYFQSLNRGKRSLTVDLSKPAGRTLIHRLVPSFDVVVINYRTGVARRLGIDYETLTAFRPDLIYASITGFGDTGPGAERAGSDIVLQTYTGFLAAEAKMDAYGAPAPGGASPVIDRATGIGAAMGICAALFHRERTGIGQELKLSLLHTGLELLGDKVMREPVHDTTNRDPLLQKLQTARAAGEPYEAIVAIQRAQGPRFASHRLYYCGYDTAEGALVIGALTQQNRDAARAVLDIHDPTDDEDFDAASPDALATIETWHRQIQDRLMGKTAVDWVDEFTAAGVPASTVNFAQEMADDPQVTATSIMVDLIHPITGPQQVVGPIVRMSETPTSITRPAPSLGAHTLEILQEAGFQEDEIARLLESRVISRDKY